MNEERKKLRLAEKQDHGEERHIITLWREQEEYLVQQMAARQLSGGSGFSILIRQIIAEHKAFTASMKGPAVILRREA